MASELEEANEELERLRGRVQYLEDQVTRFWGILTRMQGVLDKQNWQITEQDEIVSAQARGIAALGIMVEAQGSDGSLARGDLEQPGPGRKRQRGAAPEEPRERPCPRRGAASGRRRARAGEGAEGRALPGKLGRSLASPTEKVSRRRMLVRPVKAARPDVAEGFVEPWLHDLLRESLRRGDVTTMARILYAPLESAQDTRRFVSEHCAAQLERLDLDPLGEGDVECETAVRVVDAMEDLLRAEDAIDRWRAEIQPGDAADYWEKDRGGAWYLCSVIEDSDDEVYVHFHGWSRSHDAWKARRDVSFVPPNTFTAPLPKARAPAGSAA